MSRAALAAMFASSVLSTALAHADDDVPRPGATVGIGYGMLATDAGPDHGVTAGVAHASIVLTHRTASLVFDGMLGGGADQLDTVRARRLGGALRWELGRRIADEPHVALSLSVEAGAGYQRLRWKSGLAITRPDLHAGVVVRVLGRRGPRAFGIDLGIRALWARWDGDTMSPPHVNDLGVAWTITGLFR